MEEMSKKTKRLEKDNMTLTRKHDLTNQNILKMAEERSKTNMEMDSLRKKNEKLTSIINQMQKQGRGVAGGMAAMAEGSTEGEYVEGDLENTESDYDYEDEEGDDGDGEEEEGEQVEEEIVEDTGPLELPVFLKLGTFAVMLKDGKHNFRVGLQLMMSNEPAKFYLNSRMPLVKDLLNETLPAFDAKQLNSEEGRDKMRADVIEKLLLLFPKEIPGEDPRPVRKLLFEEFVVTPVF